MNAFDDFLSYAVNDTVNNGDTHNPHPPELTIGTDWKCLDCGHEYRAHKAMDDPYVGKSHRCLFADGRAHCTCEAWR